MPRASPHRPEALEVEPAVAGGGLFRSLSKVLLLAAALVVVLWFSYQIRQALLLFILALILMMVLMAPVNGLQRRGLSRGVATLVVFVAVLALAGAVGWLVVPRLVEEIPTLVNELPQVLREQTTRLSESLGATPEIERQLTEMVAWVERVLGEAWRLVGAVAAAVLFGLVLLGMTLYMVADPRPLLEWYVQLMPMHLREPAVRAFHRSSRMVVGWILANAIMGGIKAVSAFAFLTWMEVPGAIVWSVLALFAALIPRLGFYLMSIPPVVVALAVDPATALWTLVFFVVLSEFLGNFVAPHVQGEIMELHAAYLLFMTVALGLAFGLLGVLVAGPVAGFVKVFYDEFYLARQEDDPKLDERVEEMLAGSVEGMRQLGRLLRG